MQVDGLVLQACSAAVTPRRFSTTQNDSRYLQLEYAADERAEILVEYLQEMEVSLGRTTAPQLSLFSPVSLIHAVPVHPFVDLYSSFFLPNRTVARRFP